MVYCHFYHALELIDVQKWCHMAPPVPYLVCSYARLQAAACMFDGGYGFFSKPSMFFLVGVVVCLINYNSKLN